MHGYVSLEPFGLKTAAAIRLKQVGNLGGAEQPATIHGLGSRLIQIFTLW